jgi:glycosyltransferase involved in cell wall biosynthesis
MNLNDVTPLILTFNEAPNIERTLAKLSWAEKIIVVDSHSTDETLDILSQYPAVEVHFRTFDSFAAQCNFGLIKARTEWVLSLDADYVLSDALIDEIRMLSPTETLAGYRVSFVTCVLGHSLKRGLYPERTVLYRKSLASYRSDGHAHRVQIDGATWPLKSYILHDDRKSFSRWLFSQDKYALDEAMKLERLPFVEMALQDRLRSLYIPAPLVVLVYTLFVRGMIFQGLPGWYYVLQRLVAEALLSLRLIERRLL